MVKSVLEYFLLVGVAVTWVMSTVTLAVSAVTLYFVQRNNGKNRRKKGS